MNRLFLWFYCLPIPQAVLLMALAAMVFLLLREQLEDVPCWKPGVLILFSCSVALIIYATLCQRTEGSNLTQPVLMPFHSYHTAFNGGSREIFRTNFMNTVLFFPAGLLGSSLLPRRWRSGGKILLTAFVFAIVSIGIEYAQYRFGLGLAETDDVLHNTLGSLAGAFTCGFPAPRLKSLGKRK
ncbi:MAG: VanZ family protein [Oscillospiraceae bacterium]|nr:VanZ family protein [Oscillospiraceae bacterium]